MLWIKRERKGVEVLRDGGVPLERKERALGYGLLFVVLVLERERLGIWFWFWFWLG